ncbi:MAG: ABC transporter substrate-binding protein [Actinomycetota bacterium]|nr:ABC transporter substrate-binding protein [Actinomycetota bacterium]
MARSRIWCAVAALAAGALVGPACGGSGDGGAPTLKWYVFKEPSGAFTEAASRCTDAAEGRYRIELADLPASADQQREQLVRRLAAEDSDIDIIGMDVIWTAEFAEAGWILPWSEEAATAVSEGVLPGPLESSTYEDELWTAPFTSNTQLLWYRKDRVDEAPETWDDLIAVAEELGEDNLVQVQGNRYEGLTVWFNSLVASAGGSILEGSGEEPEVTVGDDATTRALEVMRDLATSSVADPTLSTSSEDEGRLAFETGGSSFMVNYTFVYPSAETNAPEVFENLAWARYPGVEAGEASKPPLGGINLGVGAYSDDPDLAFDAASCLAGAENQIVAAQKGGLPPTREALYDSPEMQEAFPFADLLRESIADAAPRPITPAYNDVSLAIFQTIHPPGSIDPESATKELEDKIGQAVTSGGLL